MPTTIPTNVITGTPTIPAGLPAGAAGGTRPFFFQQPPKIRKDDSGISVTVPYESADFNQLYNLLPALNNTSVAYDYCASFGKARLDATYAYDFINSTPQTYVQPLWEFFANKVEKDFLSANLPLGSGATYNDKSQLSFAGYFNSFTYLVSGVGSLIAADASLVRVAQQLVAQGFVIGLGWFAAPVGADGKRLQYTPDPSNPNNKIDVPAAVNPIGCNVILTLILRGQTSSPVFAPVLRFTQTVSSQYAIQASLLNAGKIISSLSMPIIENIPSGLLFSLPNDTNPPNQYIYSNADLLYGWFKDFPTIRQIARLKWNIVQEWQYGLWPVAIYGELL